MICPHRTPTHRSGAFSLNDLVGVVGAACLLTVLLLARLVHAGQESRTAACVANLQALGRSWALYAQDHAGVFVNNLQVIETQDTVGRKEYATWANNVLDWANTPFNTNVSLMATGQLAPYLESGPGVFKCPADTYLSPFQARAGWTARVRSYSMNGFAGAVYRQKTSSEARGLNPFYPAYRQFRQTTGMPNPSGIFLFLDEHPDSLNDGVYFVNPAPSTTWGDIPAAYHGGAANFSFADGHVETHAWLASNSVPPVLYRYTPSSLRGIATNDYLWVSERQSVPATTLAPSRSTSGTRELQIAWSQIATPHALQRSADPASGSWEKVTNAPLKTTGQYQVTLPATEAASFYRLAPP